MILIVRELRRYIQSKTIFYSGLIDKFHLFIEIIFTAIGGSFMFVHGLILFFVKFSSFKNQPLSDAGYWLI